ncbi:vascular endothelial growth factor receptor 1-like [Drosophila eugracilis]|uniref:vascular endothelial growth factor receptor 1-like n=1 Tax=Drosophila eugracilis TaxID=29029 RepID=UPI001BDA3D49|nr:vascular endothelial growth factor receptor 1-like [Drosophila eugracilis]
MALVPWRIILTMLLIGTSWSYTLPTIQFSADTDDLTENCGGENGAPLMTPCKNFIILNAQTTTTLKCEGNETMSWWTNHPRESIGEYFDNTEDSERPYGTSLKLFELSADDVDAYFCVKDSEFSQIDEGDRSVDTMVKLVRQGKASSIYVYVDDPQNKLVPVDSQVMALLDTEVVIPCKPAMPDTEVVLQHNNKDMHSSKSVGRYNPQRGFTIEIRSILDGGDYYCWPNPPYPHNEEESTSIEVHFYERKPLPMPVIKTSVEHHVFVDTNFTLVCEQTAYIKAMYVIKWITPSSLKDRIKISNAEIDPKSRNNTYQTGRSTLTVYNAQPSDTGVYKCVTTDKIQHKEHWTTYRIRVLGQGESYLNVSDPLGHYNVQEFANRTIQMTANYEGFSTPTFSWFKPDGTEVRQSESNFNIQSTEQSTMLQVLNAHLQDSGSYVLRGSNSFGVVDRVYNVSVIDAPELRMSDAYVQVGSVARMECTVRAYPPAIVTFLFRPCKLVPHWPTCSSFNQDFGLPSEQEKYQFQSKPRPGKLSVETIYEVAFLPTEPGILTCVAQNLVDGKERRTMTKAHVLLGNISENMTIYGFDRDHKIAKEDDVNFTCEALAYHFDGNLKWFINGEALEESKQVSIETSQTDYSYKSTVRITSISDNDRGTYECRAYRNVSHSVYSSKEIALHVHDPLAPQWVNANQNGNSKVKRKLSQTLELECASTAVPLATVRWFKDDKELTESKLRHIIEKESKLLITHLYPGDEGVYRCVVENRLDKIERSFTVVISDLPAMSIGWVLFCIVLFLVLIGISLFLAVRYHKLHSKLKTNFQNGDVDNIDPNLNVKEQADRLPYNSRFEFPRENLELEGQLGAGFFGVVLKGKAKDIRKEEPLTTVAVKMVNRTADDDVVKALVSELKIMVHLGQHRNVVNLLGAVTKNVEQRDFLVIVEYCHFGNLQNFLRLNRNSFINQISLDTDRIDPKIMTRANDGSISDSNGAGGSSDNGTLERTRIDNNNLPIPSIQAASGSNLESDTMKANTVSTSDLVRWAFQVACGMKFLSLRNVLHGDLAARNILLCENKVVKICDFGLSRSMYRGAYMRTGACKLPIKWLALESITDNVYSTYSDVWSYGILLWELFSLAMAPYPGIASNDELFKKLNDGYRMEKPPYANQELYEIMLECWRKNPESRPLFAELETRFADMLGEDEAKYLLVLNDQYEKSNMEHMNDQTTDYLAMMGQNCYSIPDFNAPTPRQLSNNPSNLNEKNAMPKMDPTDKASEEIHMVHLRSTTTDCGPRAPTAAFSNPIYHTTTHEK